MTGVALLLVLAAGVWGMVRDLKQVTESITHAELVKFQSHAERTARRIELEIHDALDLRSFVLSHQKAFEDHWNLTVRRMPEVLYGAVLDLDHHLLIDSGELLPQDELSQDDLSRENVSRENVSKASLSKASVRQESRRQNRVPSQMNGVKLNGFPENSLLLPASQLTEHKQVLDLIYPLHIGQSISGYYRAGMDFDLLQSKIINARRSQLSGWSFLLSAITAIVIGACISLYRLGLHTVQLERQLGSAESRRVDELQSLIVGLAHEVRNPLNAIRLNLFASKKMLAQGRAFDIEEAGTVLDESVEEIERVDNLVGQLLGYARASSKVHALVNLQEQIASILRFLRQSLEQHDVIVNVVNELGDATVSIDPQGFRQTLINLIQNACQAMNRGGAITICLSTLEERAVVAIHDSGAGVEEANMPKIFDPFFSTRETGVGMGLAVVKGIVESAGGSIACRRSDLLSGMEFRIELPLSKSPCHNRAEY